MDRRPVVVGNWKMELSYKGEFELARSLKRLFASARPEVDVVVCPSYPSLVRISELFERGQTMSVGAQNIHWDEKGAWTGAVSVLQIAPFVNWCIIGHSEVRRMTQESDDLVQREMSLLLRHGILPIVCIGESVEEREADGTVDKVTGQMKILLNELTRTMLSKVIICYEPIWAISANQPQALPDPVEVAGIMLLVRKLAAARFDNEAAERLRILYGGCVNPDNAAAYMKEPGVDGLLVGSASLQPRKFFEIVKIVQDVS